MTARLAGLALEARITDALVELLRRRGASTSGERPGALERGLEPIVAPEQLTVHHEAGRPEDASLQRASRNARKYLVTALYCRSIGLPSP